MKIPVLGVGLALLLVAASAFATVAPTLTPDQQQRLERGEVLFLDVLPPGGDARGGQGGTAIALVHATPDTVWHVLTDYPRHSGLYPRVTTAEVLESDASRALVHYIVGVGPFSFGFHVVNYADEARHRLVWQLAQDRRNDLFRQNWGYWQLEPDQRGSLVTYAMAARTVLPAFLTRGAERDGLLETLKAVRERAEQSQDGH